MKGRSYFLEFASVFVAVIAAFALNNWNDNRKDHVAEDKILREIRNGLVKDKEDITHNLSGHRTGLQACAYWHRLFTGQSADPDSAALHFFTLTRDFVSIQNRAGYESLKSKGLETIKDDSLRLAIIGIYEYDYNVLIKLEEDYHEAQFYKNYYHALNATIAPWATFDDQGNMNGIVPNAHFEGPRINELLVDIWKIRANRMFVMQFYREVDIKIDRILALIDQRSSD